MRAPAERLAERDSEPADTSHCYELARRPDGTIDQAVLQDCLRRARGNQKASLFEAPKLAIPLRAGPALRRED